MGKKGNVTERITSVLLPVIFNALFVPALLYLLLWQMYMLCLEVIVVAVALLFQGFKLEYAFLAIVIINKPDAY